MFQFQQLTPEVHCCYYWQKWARTQRKQEQSCNKLELSLNFGKTSLEGIARHHKHLMGRLECGQHHRTHHAFKIYNVQYRTVTAILKVLYGSSGWENVGVFLKHTGWPSTHDLLNFWIFSFNKWPQMKSHLSELRWSHKPLRQISQIFGK